MFAPMSYLEWIEGRQATATYDLGSSAVRPRPVPDDNTVVPAPLADLAQPPDDGPTLRESIAAEYGVPTDQVLVTAGATQANLLAVAAAFGWTSGGASLVGDSDDAGDVAADDAADDDRLVLVEKPGYDPLVSTPESLGATVDRFVRTAESGFALDADRVDEAVRPETSLITVSNRHNPTGYLSDREELGSVADVAADNDALLLVDEVYAPYRGDGTAPPDDAADGVAAASDVADGTRTAFGGPTAAGLPNAVATGSLTKFHGLEELCVGWLVGPADVVERARIAQTYVASVAGPSRALARRFFGHRDVLVAESRAHLTAAGERLQAFLADRDDLTASHADPDCSFAYVEHDAADGDAVAEAAWEVGILVIPGGFFGLPAGVRLSTGGDPAVIEEGLAAFGDVLDELG